MTPRSASRNATGLEVMEELSVVISTSDWTEFDADIRGLSGGLRFGV
jgi:hypothetical protein